MCVCGCAQLWACMDIWGLVDTETTVALGLGGEEPTFNPQRVVTRMTIQSEEVLRTALW